MLGFFLGSVIFALTAGPGIDNKESERTVDFWLQKGSNISEEMEKYFRKGGYQYFIHLHFAGNDFGAEKDFENETSLGDRTQVFSRTELNREDASLNVATNFSDPRVLGSLVYRHSSHEKANRAFKYLFQCENGKSDFLKQTFLLGTGGSHGVDELQKFAGQLFKDCGKKIDWAVLGDGIAQPGPLPIVHFHGLERNGRCFQYWQRYPKGLLKGSYIEECTNVKVYDVDHWSLAAYPLHWGRSVLEQLSLSEPRLGLKNFSSSIARNPEVDLLLQKINKLNNEISCLRSGQFRCGDVVE